MPWANFKQSSSLGDAVDTLRGTSTGFVVSPDFRHAAIGVTPGCVHDIDGNNSINALTDGLMLLRAMFGLARTAVTNAQCRAAVPGPKVEPTSTEIAAAA